PNVVSGPTATAAATFAGSATSGIDPNTPSSIGRTPSCAAAVTANGSHTTDGPGRRRASAVASNAMPQHAPHESANPTEWSRNGSARSSTVAAIASTRSVAIGRPRWTASIETAVIAIARSTDGSQRVI